MDRIAGWFASDYALPPFDLAVALACTMRTLRSRWIDVRCRCGHCTPPPVRLMLRENLACADRTLADVLVSLRYNGCRGRRLTLHLCEDGYGEVAAEVDHARVGAAAARWGRAGTRTGQRNGG